MGGTLGRRPSRQSGGIMADVRVARVEATTEEPEDVGIELVEESA